ncbi:dihydropteroate synthase [Desulfoferrobacter suflitae]|uniref:dihydropteroate synthase n=1 Tax=Desulfoferrobacter suflitae TaxID=2865782 RepID=UPI0021640304|nr:dihydropteroate synthase [Desulfoferrobacter suflitae]MCK8601003.1 dihydropteroate synthase [Desulfoferrobacter suflitae]
MLVIGEKINATRSSIKEIIQNRDAAALLQLAEKQAAAGAGYIDVNVGTGVGTLEDEMDSMQWAVRTIQDSLDTPLCIDSADPKVLETGLKARDGRPSMINSTKAEQKGLDEVVPLAQKYEALLVGLTMDESGIPKTADDRLRAADKIVAACEAHRVPLKNVYFDTLVMPISTDVKQGLVTLETLTQIKRKYPEAKTVLGLSNISYGLPQRSRINAAFMQMAIYAGLDGAIIDPLDTELMAAITSGEVLVGKDRHCRKYMRAFRHRT